MVFRFMRRDHNRRDECRLVKKLARVSEESSSASASSSKLIFRPQKLIFWIS